MSETEYYLDPAYWDHMRWDHFRWDVFDPIFDRAVQAFEANGETADVTHRELTLGDRDSTTGWRAKSYTTETIKMLIFPRGATFSYEGVGVYVREDAMGLCCDPVKVYDQIYKPANGKYYEIKTIQEHWKLDSFVFRECQMAELPLYEAEPASTTPVSGMPTDARYNTKDWIDTYANADHTWITLNNGTTPADFATIWENPLYLLYHEFRGTNRVEGLYVIGQPISTPKMDVLTKAPYGYVEEVPVKVYTVDSTNVTGVVLGNKMEKELRYIAETYMSGSLRSPSRMQPREIHLGSTTLYEYSFILNYERGTT